MKNISKILGFTPTLYIDDGHGEETAGKRTPPIPGLGVIKENEFNRPTANMLEEMAKEIGFRVVQSAPELQDVSLKTRSNRINDDYRKQRAKDRSIPWYQIGVGVSIHFNAYNGKFDNKKGGIEVFHSKTSTNGKRLAGLVLKNLMFGYDQVNRGIKNNNLHMTRETIPVFILAECGFMDHLEEAKQMIKAAYQKECATEILAGVCEYYGQDLEDLRSEEKPKTAIVAAATATMEQAQEWARSKGATEEFISLAPIYWDLGPKLGINPVGSYAQAAKETGYGKFGGVLDASYKNPCGMKGTNGGGDYDPKAHKRFKDWAEGIEAQMDHALLYAGAPGYPKAGTPDPRHFKSIKGTAPNWEDLGGRWAPSKVYGNSIVGMMAQIEGMPKPKNDCSKYKAEIETIKKQLEQMTSRTVAAESKLKKIASIAAK